MPPTNKLFESPRVEKLAALLLLVLSVFVALIAINQLVKLFEPRAPMGNAITVQGEGRVTAIPDIATLSFTVTEEGTNASQAQDAATKKVNVALAFVKQAGVDDKDVKTTSYSVSPRYSYMPPCYSGYCPNQEQRVVGYTVSQTVEVKVRKIDDAGTILSQLGDAGVANLYGPNFTVDDLEAVKEQARAAAIKDARAKAKTLSRDLGVSLVRVISFYENGGPIYYAKEAFGMGGDTATPSAAPAPQIPAGENEIVITVSVSYEIR